MAINEDLVFFLKNGKLANINFGIAKDHLIELLGAPEYVSQHKWSDIYGYGCFEFYIEKEVWKKTKSERFSCIVANNPKKSSYKNSFIFNYYNWTTNLTVEEAIVFLKDYQIRFEEKNEPDENDIRSLYTEGNVFIQFRDLEGTGKFTLYKYGRKVELNPTKPPTKQISLEIEEVFYNQLKEKAEETKISIASLCREIIEKELNNNS